MLERLGSAALRLPCRLLASHLKGWKTAWKSAWKQPRLGLGLLGLCMAIVVTWVLIPAAFSDLGTIRGVSYFTAVYLAMSNATFLKVARCGRNRHFPVGAVAPIFILAGVIGSSAIRPLIGEAKDAALAKDFVGAVIILGVFGVMMLWFRSLQRGTPY